MTVSFEGVRYTAEELKKILKDSDTMEIRVREDTGKLEIIFFNWSKATTSPLGGTI